MSDKVDPKVGEICENIFDYRRVTILKLKYDEEWDCMFVKYVKDNHNRDLIKPINLFKSTYKKLE